MVMLRRSRFGGVSQVRWRSGRQESRCSGARTGFARDGERGRTER